MRRYKLCIILIVAVLAVTNAAFAQLALPETVVSSKVLLAVDKLRPGDTFDLAVTAIVKSGYHIGAHDDDASYPASLDLLAPKGITFDEPAWPAAQRKAFKFAPDEKLPTYEGAFVIRVRGRVARDVRLGEVQIASKLTTQPCKDDQCFPPQTAESSLNVTVVKPGQPVRTINSGVFAPAPSAASGEDLAVLNKLTRSNVLLRVLMLYGFGLLLAFTPCVYPMVPVTVGYFSTQGRSRKTKKVIVLAGAYVLGLALTYAVLGAIAATTGGMIGSAMQRPGVLAGIAIVLVGLALSMFGLYELRPPAFIENRASGRSGILGALLMGAVFGVVAAPCVGPAVLGLLLYVAKIGNPAAGFFLFFLLALGLGTPLFLLAAFSARMPVPGTWMMAVKKVAGFLLLGAAAYFVRPIVPDPVGQYLIPAVVAAGGIHICCIERSLRSHRVSSSFGKIGGMAALAVAVAMVMPKTSAPRVTFEPYKPDVIEQAARDGRPAMLDFTAEWCADCKALERGAFSDPRVIDATRGFARYRVDGTNAEDSRVLAARERYGVLGYPAVIFFDKSGREVRSARITGHVDAGEMLRRIKSVK